MIVHNGIHQITSSNSDEPITPCRCKCFLNTTKFRNRNTELFTHTSISSNRRSHTSGSTNRPCRKTHSTSLCQTFDKHIPTKATSFLTSKNHGHWNPNVFTFYSSVHECSIQWHVSLSHSQARMITLQQCHRKPFRTLVTQQTMRILQIQSQTHNSRNRCQSNIPLLKRRTNTQLPIPHFHHTITPNQTRRITPTMRSCQSKTRNQRPICQSWQKVLFLLIRPISCQQFTRS
mmetsp:Transcript_6440/g.12134  ORF Transcript_6440/g.12134 Transcript_6440/m.12134 type:complete len:232 (+) Transcript_6440:1269-1964(+)